MLFLPAALITPLTIILIIMGRGITGVGTARLSGLVSGSAGMAGTTVVMVTVATPMEATVLVAAAGAIAETR